MTKKNPYSYGVISSYLTCHLYSEYTLSCIEGSEDTRHMYVHEHQDMKADYQNKKNYRDYLILYIFIG